MMDARQSLAYDALRASSMLCMGHRLCRAVHVVGPWLTNESFAFISEMKSKAFHVHEPWIEDGGRATSSSMGEQ